MTYLWEKIVPSVHVTENSYLKYTKNPVIFLQELRLHSHMNRRDPRLPLNIANTSNERERWPEQKQDNKQKRKRGCGGEKEGGVNQ